MGLDDIQTQRVRRTTEYLPLSRDAYAELRAAVVALGRENQIYTVCTSDVREVIDLSDLAVEKPE